MTKICFSESRGIGTASCSGYSSGDGDGIDSEHEDNDDDGNEDDNTCDGNDEFEYSNSSKQAKRRKIDRKVQKLADTEENNLTKPYSNLPLNNYSLHTPNINSTTFESKII